MNDFKVGDKVLVQVLVYEDIWVPATIVDNWPKGNLCKYKIRYSNNGHIYSKDADQVKELPDADS